MENIWTNRKIKTERQKDRKIERQKEKNTNKQKDRPTERQKDWQKDRKTAKLVFYSEHQSTRALEHFLVEKLI